MANFSSLKNVPDLFQPQNLEKIGQFFRQPIGLAVLASLGAHALLAMAMPLWSASGGNQPQAKSVPIVELSPLEQARLPESDLATALSPIPKATAKSSSTSKPTDPLSSVGILGAPALPPPPDATALYPIPLEPPIPFSGLSATSSLPRRSTPKKSEPAREIETKTTGETRGEEDKKNTKDDNKTEALKEEATGNTPSTQASDLELPEKSAKVEETDATKLGALFALSTENTSAEDFQKNAENFSNYAMDLSKGDLEQEDWKKLDAIAAPYPKQACQFKHKDEPVQGEPWFGVVIKPDGTVAGQPILLKSSGFKGLDQAAQEFIAKQKFESGKKYRGVYFPVKLAPTATDCTATSPEKPTS